MMSGNSPTFFDSVRSALQDDRYEISIEQAYLGWITRFILFHDGRHPQELGEKEVVEFLNYLATSVKTAPNMRNQAFNALLFLYRSVLDRPLENLPNAEEC